MLIKRAPIPAQTVTQGLGASEGARQAKVIGGLGQGCLGQGCLGQGCLGQLGTDLTWCDLEAFSPRVPRGDELAWQLAWQALESVLGSRSLIEPRLGTARSAFCNARDYPTYLHGRPRLEHIVPSSLR